MTYCLAIKLDSGLVFASDSRASTGMDQVSTYNKMYAFTSGRDRAFVLLSAGNMATIQAVINHIRHAQYDEENESNNFKSFRHLFDVAEYIGSLSRKAQNLVQDGLQQKKPDLGASFILGGQIGDEEPEIYLIYPEGNYIAVSSAKPYLQIGEIKYGKPILDRFITHETSLEDVARCALVSLDSTMRSNKSVGPPVELLLYRKDQFRIDHHLALELDSPLYQAMTYGWNEGLRKAFGKLPRFEWE